MTKTKSINLIPSYSPFTSITDPIAINILNTISLLLSPAKIGVSPGRSGLNLYSSEKVRASDNNRVCRLEPAGTNKIKLCRARHGNGVHNTRLFYKLGISNSETFDLTDVNDIASLLEIITRITTLGISVNY